MRCVYMIYLAAHGVQFPIPHHVLPFVARSEARVGIERPVEAEREKAAGAHGVLQLLREHEPRGVWVRVVRVVVVVVVEVAVEAMMMDQLVWWW